MRLPAMAMLPASFVCSLGLWSAVLAPSLLVGSSLRWPLLVYIIIGSALLVGSWLRDHRRGRIKRGLEHAACVWSFLVVLLCALAGAILRTRMAFDTLFHVGMVRRIAELGSLRFDNLDRVVGAGVNPAYVLPSWQALLAAAVKVTSLDPATIVEAGAIVGVVLAACSAAALGRAAIGSASGELVAVATYAFVRVLYPRRELEGDGVAYAALAGNIALDVLLVMVFVCIFVLLRSRSGMARTRALYTMTGLATFLLIVLHANYAAYLAVMGLGVVAWLVLAGPWNWPIARRLGAVMACVMVSGGIVLGLLLPTLMTLDHFGAPIENRIDYHLISALGVETIRPGHLYDWFAAPGLIAMLLIPWAAWVTRGITRAFIAGGALCVILFSLVPGLTDLLTASGSMTISLRLPRLMGIVMIVAMAAALPDLTARCLKVVRKVRIRFSRVLSWGIASVPFVLVIGLSARYGYPLVRREPAQYGWNWPTVLTLSALLLLLGFAVLHRRTAGSIDQVFDASSPVSKKLDRVNLLKGRDRQLCVPSPLIMVMVLVVFTVAMLPSGVVSMRRAGWQAREFVAAYRADDLGCFDGVQRALRSLPAGEVLLADPVTAYGAQALAPTYIVGDYKVWNGSTDQRRIEHRMRLLDQTFQSDDPREAQMGVDALVDEFQARWILVAAGEVVPPIGSDLNAYDAEAVRRLLNQGVLHATLVSQGRGRETQATSDEDRAACDLQLWKLAIR